jgi:tetratricopeptide (TPR) repeat protein
MTDEAQEQQRKRSAELLERAVAADPKFALGWASLSRTYATVAWNTMFSDYRAYADKARRAAERAVAFGADLPEAHLAMGSVALQLDFDFPRAARELELAVRGAPRQRRSSTRAWRSRTATTAASKTTSALAVARTSWTRPSCPMPSTSFARSTYLRRTDDALALMRQVATLRPDNYSAASSPAWIECGAWRPRASCGRSCATTPTASRKPHSSPAIAGCWRWRMATSTARWRRWRRCHRRRAGLFRAAGPRVTAAPDATPRCARP